MTISLGGLASGIDTDSIVTQLMAVEGQSKTRLQLSDAKAKARDSGLSDLATKLGALRDAANALKTSTTWGNVQRTTSSDPARVSVSAASGAAPGPRSIEVTALAVTSQHAFGYTASSSPQTITVGSFALAVAANSTATTVASAINDRSDSPMSAVVAGGKLVFTSRTSGAGGDFSVAATPLLAEDAGYARAGSDASYTIDGIPKTSASNVVTDAILGVDLTLKATTTAPVSIAVTDPGPDTDAVKAKLTAFVSAYNGAVDFIRGKLSEDRVKNPSTAAEAAKGLFAGDTMLSGVLTSMRAQVGDLAALGISTGAVTGSATVSADAIAGKLRVDDTKLTAALTGNRDALHTALTGLGGRVSDVVTPVAGARVTAARASVTAERKTLADAMTRTDVRLADKEKRLRAQFAAMESALAASQAAQSQMAAQLSSLG
jgi:flagellar hook-associated protein 2